MKTIRFYFNPVYSGIHDTIYRCEKGEDHSGEYVKKEIMILELREIVATLEGLIEAGFQNNCISIASELYHAKGILDKYKADADNA